MSNNFKPMKIWIGDNPELSKMVQEALFKKGYEWVCGNKMVRCTGFKCLFVSNYGLITWSDSRSDFKENDSPEATFSDIFHDIPERETITIGNQKFYKDDFENAVKDLEVVK